jgi:DNA polymerase-1
MGIDSISKELILLFDGHAVLYRAFHALPPLTVPKTGEMINAVYGFASTALKVLGEFHPTYWAVAFDRPTPTFRHEQFKEYKAQRPEMPQELKSQMGRVHQLVEVFNVPIFEVDGFEADDVLGTLSNQARDSGVDVIIVTADNDMLQLVLPQVKALVPGRGLNDVVLYDEEAVYSKYGVEPEQVIDLKSLVGDVSDNIPGVPGIGGKTAARLLQTYGNLEQVYVNIEAVVPAKLQLALRQYRDQVFQNKELVTIVKNVPITLSLDDCRVNRYERSKVAQLFRELGFAKLFSRLPRQVDEEKHTVVNQLTSESKGQIIATEADLHKLIKGLEATSICAIDVETSRMETRTAEIVGLAISPAKEEVSYIPVGHVTLGDAKQLPLIHVISALKPILEDGSKEKIAHDGKFTMRILASYGVEVKNVSFDTMIAAYLLGEKNLSLGVMAFNRLGMEIMSLDERSGTRKKNHQICLMDISQVADHACSNISAIWRLHDLLSQELHQKGLWKLFKQVEMPLLPVLATMERRGISLDVNLLEKMSVRLGNDLLNLEAEIYNSIGHRFNINSPKQLASVLFEDLRLPQSRKTKGSYSTEASVLKKLIDVHPVVALILEYRQLSKLKSTYIDALPLLVDSKTGRLHTTFNQAGTTTGRLSSSEPNLQNIPVRGGLGSQIRQAFVASPGSYLLSADYSQIDLRVLSHLSQDPHLIAAFINGEDIHAATASSIFAVSKNEVTPDMRRVAKTVNFGIIYGMSDYGLEQATELSRSEAARFITLYFERHPKVKEYIETTKKQAKELGYVQTVLGHRRLIPEINSPNKYLRESAERMAINAPVQGSSADIIKVAMVTLHRDMKGRNLHSKMLLQIHDELIFEVPSAEIAEMASLVTEAMVHAIELYVPLRVDLKSGKNWKDMSPLGE